MNIDRAAFLVLTSVLAAATACASSDSDAASGGQAVTASNTPATPPASPSGATAPAPAAPAAPAVTAPRGDECLDPDKAVSPAPFQEGDCFDMAIFSTPNFEGGFDAAVDIQCEAYAQFLKPSVAVPAKACMEAAKQAAGPKTPLKAEDAAKCVTDALAQVCPAGHPSAEGICFSDIGPAFEGFENVLFVEDTCVRFFAGLTDAGAQQLRQCMLDASVKLLAGTSDQGSAGQALKDCVAQMKPTG
jgi:hypothetical protein